MITFKEYLVESESAVMTKRQNMLHLQKMKDIEFIDFIKSIKNTMDGKLQNLKVSLKIDGGGGRFGKDINGKPFFEGSRTGPIFEPNAFSAHAKSKNYTGEALLRAEHYDKMWELITTSSLVKALPNNTKIICELLYNPMGQMTKEGIKFVTITYDKNKLGKLLTIVPFKVVVASTGQEHAQSSEIIDSLYKLSNDNIKVVNPNLKTYNDIDINAFIDPILSLNDNSITLLNSRKAIDKPAKENTKLIIQIVKDKLAEYILNHNAIVDKFKLGPDIEGLVLNINGQDVKVTTPEFKQLKRDEK